MRKIILVTVILFSLISCTLEDNICGTIQRTYIGYNEYTGEITYYFYINGQKKQVNTETWLNYTTGDNVCITY